MKAGESRTTGFLSKVLPRLVTALFAALLVYTVMPLLAAAGTPTDMSISAAQDGGPVTFRGAVVDGKWLNISDVLVSAGNWAEDPEQLTYTSTDDSPLLLELPQGKERSLVFNAGPGEGTAVVEYGEEDELEFDLYSETAMEQGLNYPIPEKDRQLYVLPVAAAVFFVIFMLLPGAKEEKRKGQGKDREVSGDLLRGVCCFTVVLLHCTCNRLNSFGEPLSAWYPHLVMNSLTAFAVPSFYMISGAYLLGRPQSIRHTLRKRVPSLLIPLLFWSVLYNVVNRHGGVAWLAEMFFQPQTAHLWFMYCILGIYFLLPLLSKAYGALGEKEKIYLIVLLLVVPSVLHDLEHALRRYVQMPYFAVFWPDLGLFFLGAFLKEHICALRKYRDLMPLAFVLGWALTAGLTLFASVRDGALDQNFISCIGSIGVMLMAAALPVWMWSHEEKLKKLPERMKSLIHVLGQTSMGIYLIHVLVMQLLNHNTVSWLPLASNEGSMVRMCLSAAGYFVISAVICWSGKKTPLAEKVL